VFGGDTYSRIFNSIDCLRSDTCRGWMQGYHRWFSAMFNCHSMGKRMLTTPEALDTLKMWLFNHTGDKSFAEGGIASGTCSMSEATKQKIPEGMYGAGKTIFLPGNTPQNHQITWVGYDDSVGYDANGDGTITNHLDITGEGQVTWADWERGALIMLNSWGAGFGDSGIVYIPYRMFARHTIDSTSPIYEARYVYIRKDYQPRQTLRILLDYSERGNLMVSVGVSADTAAAVPDKKFTCPYFYNKNAGTIPMLGLWADSTFHSEPMEFGINMTDIVATVDTMRPYKLFLIAQTSDSATGTGALHTLSALTYRYADPLTLTVCDSVEYVSPRKNLKITGAGTEVIASVVIPAPSMTSTAQGGFPVQKLALQCRVQNSALSFIFNLSRPEAVSVDIFSLNGKNVGKAQGSFPDPGAHSLQWQPGTNTGGVFLYRLHAGDVHVSGRVVMTGR
jgi:hypothetical protein